MTHISEIIDDVLPSLIDSTRQCQDSKRQCQYTDEARAAEAGLSVEEWRKAMNDSCKYQNWLDRMKEAHATESEVR